MDSIALEFNFDHLSVTIPDGNNHVLRDGPAINPNLSISEFLQLPRNRARSLIQLDPLFYVTDLDAFRNDNIRSLSVCAQINGEHGITFPDENDRVHTTNTTLLSHLVRDYSKLDIVAESTIGGGSSKETFKFSSLNPTSAKPQSTDPTSLFAKSILPTIKWAENGLVEEAINTENSSKLASIAEAMRDDVSDVSTVGLSIAQ